MRLIFDGHLDLALFALCHNRDQTETVAQINAREAHMTDALERGGATVSLPEMRRAGVAVCQSSIAARANREVQPVTGHQRIDLDYGTQRMAYAWAQGQLAYYRILSLSVGRSSVLRLTLGCSNRIGYMANRQRSM